MGIRRTHSAALLLFAMLIAIAPPCAWATGPGAADLADHDEELKRAAIANTQRFVDFGTRKIEDILKEKVGPAIETANGVMAAAGATEEQKIASLAEVLKALVNPNNGLLSRVPPQSSEFGLFEFLKTNANLGAGASGLLGKSIKKLVDEGVVGLPTQIPPQVPPKPINLATTKTLVGLANLFGQPNIRDRGVQFIKTPSNQIIVDYQELGKAIDQVDSFTRKFMTPAVPAIPSDKPVFPDKLQRLAIADELVSIKTTINAEQGLLPDGKAKGSPNSPFARNQNGQQQPGLGQGQQPGGQSGQGGGGQGGGGSGGGGQGGGGGGAQAQHSQIPQLNPAEIPNFNGKFNNQFAQQLGQNGQVQDLTIANGQNLGPRQSSTRDLFAGATGLVQDIQNYAGIKVTQNSQLAALRKASQVSSALALKPLSSVFNAVQAVAAQPRPRTTVATGGPMAGGGGSPGGKFFPAGAVRPGGGSAGFPADAMAGGNRGAERGPASVGGPAQATGSERLNPKFRDFESYARAHKRGSRDGDSAL